MKTNPDEPAYPDRQYGPSLTKRELFAAMAMQGISASAPAMSNIAAPGKRGDECNKMLTKVAVSLADALIESLNQRDAVDTPPPMP